MTAAQHIVKLDPDAVELVDRTMIDLARANPAFAPVVARFIRGAPEAILLVEFAGAERAAQVVKLAGLVELMGDLGLPGSVVEVIDTEFQKEIWEVRKAGLNIMMSMKGDGKPVSFIEDCAVPLEHLAEYTDRLTRVFEKHGTKGTWYAHASVGTLHVRPVLNMKGDGAKKMRAIAEEACAHGARVQGRAIPASTATAWCARSGSSRSSAPASPRALAEIKALFDPKGLMNPGKIVRPSKMDDAALFRFKPGYADPAPGRRAGLVASGTAGAASRASRRRWRCATTTATAASSMPGRCARRSARPAMSSISRAAAPTRCGWRSRGSSGPEALASDAVHDAMDLCVACKGCKRECPTGVDMARMKIEFLHHYHGRHGWGLKDRLVAFLPRYAPIAARFAPLANLRDRVPFLAAAASARRLLARNEACRSGGARVPALDAGRCQGDRRRTATSCCSPTPSTITSSRRTRSRHCACSRPPAIACTSRALRTAAGRCAAAARFSPRHGGRGAP